MIANDIRSTADFVAGFALRGEPLSPRALGHLAQVLMDFAEQVDRLEHVPFTLAPPEHHDADA